MRAPLERDTLAACLLLLRLRGVLCWRPPWCGEEED